MPEKYKTKIVIQAGHKDSVYWKDLWRYRELFYFLSWRDIIVRYKQAAIGIAWAVLRPLLTMLVFTIVFGKFAKLPSNDIPYPILVLSALIPWQFFSNAFNDASNSLVNNSHIISKIYFPRIIIPMTSIIVNLVDFFIAFILLLLFMVWYRVFPDWRIIFLPFYILLTCFVALGAGLWIAALNVKYRDFKYIVSFFVQFGIYISPVGYSSTIIPDNLRFYFSLNPLVGIIDGFRWVLFGNKFTFYIYSAAASVLITTFLIAIGVFYFRKTEKTFADII